MTQGAPKPLREYRVQQLAEALCRSPSRHQWFVIRLRIALEMQHYDDTQLGELVRHLLAALDMTGEAPLRSQGS